MTAQLDDLFKEILQSEKIAQERKALLDSVRKNVSNYKVKLAESKGELKALQGQLAVKANQLSENEAKLKLVRNRSKILKDVRDAQKEEHYKLTQKKKVVKEEFERSAEQFDRDVETFCSEYDLVATLSNQREKVAKDQIEKLKIKERSLSEELIKYDERQKAIENLRNQISSVQQKIKDAKVEVKEVNNQIKGRTKETQELEEKKKNVSDIPQTSSDFRRLNRELEEHHETGRQLDEVCSSLQAELQELKQARWRNQLQQTRKQQQQQQQQTQQKHKVKEKDCSSGLTNFKRMSNYARDDEDSMVDEETNLFTSSDFVAASALLDEEDEMEENSPVNYEPASKKVNLSKLTEGIKNKRTVKEPSEPQIWRFQRTGKFQCRKQVTKNSSS